MSDGDEEPDTCPAGPKERAGTRRVRRLPVGLRPGALVDGRASARAHGHAGARRGGLGGGLLALPDGPGAARGHGTPRLPRGRAGSLDGAMRERGYAAQGPRGRRVRGIVPGKRFAVVDANAGARADD